MDHRSFDALARSLAGPRSRRGLLGGVATLAAALVGARSVGAQVTQAQCGNKLCRTNPAVCTNGCVCCVYANGNSRCRPPGECGAGEIVVGSTTTTPAPTTTTTTTTTTIAPLTTTVAPTTTAAPACVPDPDQVTCTGVCGPQTNNCEQPIDCGLCGAGAPCAGDGQCASDHCCGDTCIDCSAVSATATSCGGCGNCCECFSGDSFGPPHCCDATNICGTYPSDVCCFNGTTCVDGTCVKPVYVCPYEIGGNSVDCRGQAGAGCCNGVCCPLDKPVCLNGACSPALPACTYPDNLACPDGSGCTATEWSPDGVCCTNIGSYSPGTENGEPIIYNVCCGLNQKWGNDGVFDDCPTCVPRDYCGCNSCTSRTSTPRV